jgi:hypothetical protein
MDLDIENLTVKQLRALAAQLTAVLPSVFQQGAIAQPAELATVEAQEPAPILFPAGSPVWVRDHLAGLIVGRLAVAYRVGDKAWAMASGSRKIHYWTAAAGPEGAVVKPGPNSRVCRPVPTRTGTNVVEIGGLTEEELATTLALPVWTP